MLILDQLRRNDRHLQAVSICFLAGMGILLAALWYVQVVSAKRYQTNLQKQSYRIVRVPAVRGKILDRNGIPLSDNRPRFNVNLYLEEFSQRFREAYKPYVEVNRKLSTAEKLKAQGRVRYQVISSVATQVGLAIGEPFQLEEKDFTDHFLSRLALPLAIFQDLRPTNVACFVEKASHLPALALEVEPLRVYPYNTLAAHLIGHLRKENRPEGDDGYSFHYFLPDFKGAMGIESALDEQIRGRAGIRSILVNNLSYKESEDVLVAPEPGQDVVLTIDLATQQAAERAMSSGGTNLRGAAVVLDVRSGDILAMVSHPAFDPNHFLSGISPALMAQLNDEHLLPLLNRATLGGFPPGSVFKIIDTLACLEAGLDPEEVYQSKGYWQIRGRGRKWDDLAEAGSYNLKRAFYKSSNAYFQEMGWGRIGPEKLVEIGRQFRLGEPTGVQFLKERAGYFPPPGDKLKKRNGAPWMEGDTANLCIGQGEIEVTPLQIAVLVASLANGGKILKPRLVAQIGDANRTNSQAIQFPSGQVRSELKVSARSMEILRDAMLADTEQPDATGKAAFVKGLKIYGKTGTAQDHGEHTVWFASFAEFNGQPRWAIAIAVQVEHGGSGGGTCAPLAKIIYQELLKQAQRSGNASLNLAHN